MKKFNADYITRTVVYTVGTAVSANLETMKMDSFTFTITGTFKKEDLLPKVKEIYGDEVVGVKEVSTHEEKRRISVEDFLRYSEVIAKEDRD